MRLSDILSNQVSLEYVQIDGFLQDKKGNVGQKVDVDVGKIALNFYCEECRNLRTFYSKGKISCIFINKNVISIDAVLVCGCGTTVAIWFLVESKNEITCIAPEVRILKRTIKLSNSVKFDTMIYGEYTEYLNKSLQSYYDGLGAGSIVYLRKIYEKVTITMANLVGIEYEKYEGGNPKNFSILLEKVDEKCSIVPKEFSDNRYKLFKELSNVVHGNYDEKRGLEKFESLYRLIIGILENIKNHEDYLDAMSNLGWNKNDE